MDDITTPSMSTELEDSAPEMISRSSEDIETHNQNLPSHEVCTEMEENSISTAGVHATGVDEALVSMNLTEEERSTLMNVMAKAKYQRPCFSQDFDSTNQASPMPRFNQELEGQLLKHTNMVKGWQPRYFRLDPRQAILFYYISEDKKRSNPPRGFLHLWGAVISPSDEDSQTFNICGANSEVFRLKASDAKERQKWITHLRAAVNRISNAHIPSPVREAPSAPAASMTQSLPVLMATTSAGDHLECKGPAKRTSFSKFFQSSKNAINRPPKSMSRSKLDPFLHEDKEENSASSSISATTTTGIDDTLSHVKLLQKEVTKHLDTNHTSLGVDATNKDLLLFKATTLAMAHCLEECVSLVNNPSVASHESAVNVLDSLLSNGQSGSNKVADQLSTNSQTSLTLNKQTAI
ncbi:oxysterol-binding protein-related protein 11-like isoform X2 [Dysidea avara]|uniref:oxysterol-binding protein-related protein 11-like isoform X2 n=1 Tax=Dysidea avara TaxID=196820 RepID=UPI00331B3FD1